MSFDKQAAESRMIDSLIDKGFHFHVNKISILRWFGSKKRKFTITEPYLGTLDLLTKQVDVLGFSEEDLKGDPLVNSANIYRTHKKEMAKFVAIALLNRRCVIITSPVTFIYNRPLIFLTTKYLLMRLKPTDLAQLVLIVRYLMNLSDFMSSIRFLTTTMTKTTTPKADLIEGKQ